MQFMLISIIVPIYNVEKYIERCLDSVYNQTYNHIEVILVNDCTTDNSFIIAIETANKYIHKYKTYFVNHNSNMGLSEARNSGIEKSKGEYLYFVDSDDEIERDAISSLIDVLQQNPDLDLIKGLYRKILSNGVVADRYDSRGIIRCEGTDCCKEMILGSAGPMVWNSLIKKDIILQNQVYFAPIFYEDILFSFHLSKYIKKMFVLNKETYIYYSRPESISNSKISEQHFASRYYGINQMIREISNDYYYRKYQLENIIIRAFNLLNREFCSFVINKNNFEQLSKEIIMLMNADRINIGMYYALCLPAFYLPYKLAIIYFKIISTIQRVYTTTKKRIHS